MRSHLRMSPNLKISTFLFSHLVGDLSLRQNSLSWRRQDTSSVPKSWEGNSVCSVQFSLSHVRLFVTPWTTECQASLSITNSQSLLRLMSIESMMPSNHLILCLPLLSSPSPLNFNLFQHQGLFKWVSSLHQVAKILEFQLQHQSFQWIFRTDFL